MVEEGAPPGSGAPRGMGLAVAGGEEEKRGRCVDMIDFDAARRDDAAELKLFVFVRRPLLAGGAVARCAARSAGLARPLAVVSFVANLLLPVIFRNGITNMG